MPISTDNSQFSNMTSPAASGSHRHHFLGWDISTNADRAYYEALEEKVLADEEQKKAEAAQKRQEERERRVDLGLPAEPGEHDLVGEHPNIVLTMEQRS